MFTLYNNQKGVVLITTYLVVVILLAISGIFFARTVQEGNLAQRQNDSLKALYNAEKGIAYAYLECANQGWNWHTHNWDAGQNQLLSNNLGSGDAQRTQGSNADCQFINSGPDAGAYAAEDGSFVLKTFSDPESSGAITIAWAKGISGGVERIIECRFGAEAIFDFAWWTPYDLSLNNVGRYVNGGRVHSNGNIYMYNAKRLYGVDSISTGKDKSIYYTNSRYYAPGYYDYYMDGSRNINGEVPLPHLDTPRRWAGTSEEEPYATQYPWLYERYPNDWQYRSYGYNYAGRWPPRDWRDEDSFFYGSNNVAYNRTVEGRELNYYNTWIYPVQKDEYGNILFDERGRVLREPPEEIPSELEGAMWDWEKYSGFSRTFGRSAQQELKFTVYDPEGEKKYVEDTRWKIDRGQVVMTGLNDPAGKTYWDMLDDYDYWRATGSSDSDAQYWSTHINPEVLDGTYGSEIPLGQTTIEVDNTNSINQPAAWNNFLQEKGLEDVLLANERGRNMEPPRFVTTYKVKTKDAGMYFSKSGGTHTLHYGDTESVSYTANECGDYNPDNPDAYADCLEANIDVLVETLNTDAQGESLPLSQQPAKKVKFINTYTNQWNVVLELDLENMKETGKFPTNGIIYSELPVRLSNAQQLPSLADPQYANFNLISEENIFLKGNYNNPSSDEEWMPSAIISKKQIYTLSEDFNDPQVAPAFVHYPNYPYVYVRTNPGGSLMEADPNAGGGEWVYYGWYRSRSPQYNQAYNLMTSIDRDWRRTFEQNDPTGSATYTVSSSHPIINGQTWGAMPNRVENNYAYNCLMASYYYGYQGWTWIDVDGDGDNDVYAPDGSLPYGVDLERWRNDRNQRRSKSLLGAYFQLDWAEEDDENRFTAHQSDGPVDYYYYAGFDPRANSRVPGSRYSGPYYLEGSPSTSKSYDSRFRNPMRTQSKGIFFGVVGILSWREVDSSLF